MPDLAGRYSRVGSWEAELSRHTVSRVDAAKYARVYEMLREKPMAKAEVGRALGLKGNDSGAYLVNFENLGFLLWEDGNMVGVLEDMR